jgi:hypothetical protein
VGNENANEKKNYVGYRTRKKKKMVNTSCKKKKKKNPKQRRFDFFFFFLVVSKQCCLGFFEFDNALFVLLPAGRPYLCRKRKEHSKHK